MIRSGKYGELITLNDYEWMVVAAAQMGGLQVADPTPVAPNPGMSLEQIKNALLFRVGDKDVTNIVRALSRADILRIRIKSYDLEYIIRIWTYDVYLTYVMQA